MDDLQSSEESAFVPEDVTAIMKEVGCDPSLALTGALSMLLSLPQAIDAVLANATYQHTKVPQWTNNVSSLPLDPRHAPTSHTYAVHPPHPSYTVY
jgi:hypothetical protein